MQLGLGISLVHQTRPRGGPLTPSIPVVLTLDQTSPGEFYLGWSTTGQESQPGFLYVAYVSFNDGTWTAFDSLSSGFNETTYNATEWGNYRFKIQVVNDYGTGPDSNIVEGDYVDPLLIPATPAFVLRTYNRPDDLTPRGIVSTAGAANPTIADVTTPGGLILSQATALNQALTQYVNGVPVLRFDGAGDYYPGTYSTPHSRDDFTTLLLVKRVDSGSPGFNSPWFGGSYGTASGNAGVPLLGRRGVTTQWGVSNAYVSDATSGVNYLDQGVNALTWQATALRGAGGVNGVGRSLTLWAGGQKQTTTQSWTSASQANFCLGGYGMSGERTFPGDIIAVVHYRSALSDADIENIILPYLATLIPPP